MPFLSSTAGKHAVRCYGCEQFLKWPLCIRSTHRQEEDEPSSYAEVPRRQRHERGGEEAIDASGREPARSLSPSAAARAVIAAASTTVAAAAVAFTAANAIRSAQVALTKAVRAYDSRRAHPIRRVADHRVNP